MPVWYCVSLISNATFSIMDKTDSPNTIPPKKPRKQYDKKIHGNRYTLARKLAVKARIELGHSPTEIANDEGMDRSTVYNVMQSKTIGLLAPKQVDEIKKSLIGMKYGNAFRAQEKITDSKLDAMNAYQLTLISSINVDKARLMENLSTENVSHRGLTENLEADRLRIMEKLQSLSGESV